ncbi:MAG: HlyD family secretion protein [Hyphomonadaceae bacterium]|nr:HlyD family secretion protein [Hyphomonadaceae bacterium]
MQALLHVLRRPQTPRLAAGAAAVLVIAGLVAWSLDRARWQATDNAYVKADTVIISPRIDGAVLRVLVEDNQPVRAGDVLVEIDPADVRARVAQAEATLAAAEAAVRHADARAAEGRSLMAATQAGVAGAEAQARLARTDLARYADLAQRGWVAQQRVQSARAQNDQAAAGLRQARAAAAAQGRDAAALAAERAEAVAAAKQARAALERARLDLDHATIRAPVAGVVGARGVRAGQVVRTGANLMSVVPLGETYVVANFKETQVARMRIGQAVEIRADAFGGRRIAGRVESFAPATGSEFALIPVENATGNFTKIVQRVPVKIALARDEPLSGALRPGLSIHVKVDLHSQGAATFAESAMQGAPPDTAAHTSKPTARPDAAAAVEPAVAR